MDERTRTDLADKLHRRRIALLREVARDEEDLKYFARQEPELEERAQEDRLARLIDRLDDRAKHEIEEIDAALQRMSDDTYGICAACGNPIEIERLRVLPTTRLCARDAREARPLPAESGSEAAEPRRGTLPPDLANLSESELEQELHEEIRADGRVDMEELHISSRRGVVHLHGAVPSENEHQILLKILTDELGISDIVDRLQVKEILWEREDRTPEEPPPEEPISVQPFESPETEDVVASEEEGLEYSPPSNPPPDEEKE